MIKTLSPYYLNIFLIVSLSFEVCSSFTLQIFAWNGNKIDVPLEPIYEITKDNPALFDGSVEINISLLINDFIDFMPNFSNTTELVNGNNQYWVKTQIFYTTSNESDYTANFQEIVLFLQGYGYGLDGKNPQLPTNKILLSGTEFKVSRDSCFVFPFLIQEPTDDSELILEDVQNTTGDLFEYTFSINFTAFQIYVQFLIDGIWTDTALFADTTSPQIISTDLTGNFTTRIYTYNVATGNIIYSNEFEYIA